MDNSAQQRFDERYVCGPDICRGLGVSRYDMLIARRKGLLPAPITLNNSRLFIWEREAVAPFVQAWAQRLGREYAV